MEVLPDATVVRPEPPQSAAESRRGWVAIGTITLACLLFFLVTASLPRVDGHLLGSDGIGYYLYLPSVLLDRDLDLSNQTARLYAFDPRLARAKMAERTATGRVANRLGIGPALLWLPFFLAAHAVVLTLSLLGVELIADGTGWIYQLFVVSGSILYAGAGLWCCLRLGCTVASPAATRAALIVFVLASNLVYYMTIEPSMSHPLSVFASSAFFVYWLHHRDRLEPGSAFRVGALGGLMALVRPQDGLLLLLPLLDSLSHREGREGRRLLSLVGTLAGAGVVFSPQLLTWRILNGGFLSAGYTLDEGSLFAWTRPHLLDVLFSAERGLFLWHPVFLLSLAGLLLACGQDRRLAAAGISAFLIQWYVTASWHDWSQGDAFGGRMFLVLTPVCVVGLASLVERLLARRYRRSVLLAATVLIVLNLLFALQYRVELLGAEDPPSLGQVTVGRLRMLVP